MGMVMGWGGNDDGDGMVRMSDWWSGWRNSEGK